MNNKLKLLFAELNKYWCAIDSYQINADNTGYNIIQQKIFDEIKGMSSQMVIGLIDELSDIQINQIIPIVEDIIKLHPQTKHIFKSINEEWNIYCLDNELKTLGII
jgi:PhoPQ-activated pathogenicity-related protein